MLGERRDMKTVFLGYKNERLDNYKKEMKKIRNCMACSDAITESGSYGELGYIVRRTSKGEECVGFYYDFTKLCPNCFGEVYEVLRRIRKESKKKGGKDGP